MESRRNFLKYSLLGLGALSFSPYLTAENTNVLPKSQFPKRFIFIRKSNGAIPSHHTLPTLPDNLKAKDTNKEAFEVALDKHELPEFMRELENYKEHLTILQGLSSSMCEGGHEAWQSIMGCFHSGGGSISRLKRVTIDYELGKIFPSPFGAIEFSFAGNRHGIVPGYSVPNPYTQNFCYADSITAYNDLFKCVIAPESISSDDLMLNYLKTDKSINSGIAGQNDIKNSKNFESAIHILKEKNNKLKAMKPVIAKNMPDFEMIKQYGRTESTVPEKQEAMTEIILSALISGMTNVVTYTIDNLGTSMVGLPGNEKDVINIHAVGHNGSYSGVSAYDIRKTMNMQHIKQIKTIVDRLKAQPEGNGNMFDNTMIMYFPEGGAGHHGPTTDPTFVMMSGKNCNIDIAGRYIRLPFHGTEGHQTLGNWYTTLLNAHGNPIPHYGDLDRTMSAKKLPQEGAIKRFMKG